MQKVRLDTITEEQFRQIIDVIPTNKFINARDRAIFSLMFYAGLKEREILPMRYNGFTRVEGRITHVFVRGGYERKLELPADPEKVSDELLLYERLYRRLSDNLMVKTYWRNKHAKPITDMASIRKKLKSWSNEAGVYATGGILTDSYSVRLLESGVTEQTFIKTMGFHKKELNKFLVLYAKQKFEQPQQVSIVH